jgi:hypothetical protein
MKVTRMFFGLSLLFALGTATAQKVSVDWEKTADFSNFKTYTWAEGTTVKNQLMDQRIVDGIDKHLAAKGLQKVDASGNPDLVVLYHGAVDQETQLNTTNMGPWGPLWGGGMATTTVDKIPVGQLVVHIGDAKAKKLLWLGTATGTLSENPEKNEKKINEALDKMFKKFPPPEKK